MSVYGCLYVLPVFLMIYYKDFFFLNCLEIHVCANFLPKTLFFYSGNLNRIKRFFLKSFLMIGQYQNISENNEYF